MAITVFEADTKEFNIKIVQTKKLLQYWEMVYHLRLSGKMYIKWWGSKWRWWKEWWHWSYEWRWLHNYKWWWWSYECRQFWQWFWCWCIYNDYWKMDKSTLEGQEHSNWYDKYNMSITTFLCQVICKSLPINYTNKIPFFMVFEHFPQEEDTIH